MRFVYRYFLIEKNFIAGFWSYREFQSYQTSRLYIIEQLDKTVCKNELITATNQQGNMADKTS